MRKFLCMIIIALFISFPLVCHGEKTTWQNSKFNFKDLNNIEITEISQNFNNSMRQDELAEEKITSFLEKAIEKKKIPLGKKEYFLLYPREDTDLSEYGLTIDIDNYGYFYYFKEGYWENYTTWREEHFVDRHGNWHSVSIPITQTRYNPPENVQVCVVDIKFTLTDLATKSTLYTLRDRRDRETASPDDMAKRIINSFLENLNKLRTKGKV